jgi:hypothetical protein
MADDITAERLAEIRARAKNGYYGLATTAARDLLGAIDARDAEIERLREHSDVPSPCDMKHQPPMDFAYCETHDTTFPLGGVCKWHGKTSVAEVLQAEVDEQRQLKVRAEMEIERLRGEPTDAEVEAGARAGYNLDRVRYANPGRFYDEIPEESRQIVRDTARAVLTAAREVRHG